MHEHPEYDVIMTKPDLNTPYILVCVRKQKLRLVDLSANLLLLFDQPRTLRHEQSGITLSASLTLSQIGEFKV